MQQTAQEIPALKEMDQDTLVPTETALQVQWAEMLRRRRTNKKNQQKKSKEKRNQNQIKIKNEWEHQMNQTRSNVGFWHGCQIFFFFLFLLISFLLFVKRDQPSIKMHTDRATTSWGCLIGTFSAPSDTTGCRGRSKRRTGEGDWTFTYFIVSRDHIGINQKWLQFRQLRHFSRREGDCDHQ